MTLTPQRHKKAVSQSGRQVRGGDDHCVWAHSVEKIHNLEPVVEYTMKHVCKQQVILFRESHRLPLRHPSLC